VNCDWLQLEEMAALTYHGDVFRVNSGLILRGNDAGHNQGNHKGEELHSQSS